MQQPELWIGLVEVKPLDRKAYGAAGAFTNIVTWACDIEEFRKKTETIAATLDMFVVDVEGAAPLTERIKAWSLPEEIEDMVLRATTPAVVAVLGSRPIIPKVRVIAQYPTGIERWPETLPDCHARRVR